MMSSELQPVSTKVPTLSDEVLAMRRGVVTSTEVAALFGCGFETRLELWHRKRAGLDREQPEFPGADELGGPINPLVRGSVLEPAIAHLVAIETNLPIYRLEGFYPAPGVEGLGSSLEYEIILPQGAAHLEIKSATYWAHLRWSSGRGGDSLLKAAYEVQARTQLFCAPVSVITGEPYVGNIVACMVSIDRLKFYPPPDQEAGVLRFFGRDPMFEATLVSEVDGFWHSIREDTPPPPDLERDLRVVLAIQAEELKDASLPINLRHDEAFNQAVKEVLAAQEATSEAGAVKARNETLIRSKASGPRVALAQDGRVKFQKRAPVACKNCGLEVRKESVTMTVSRYRFDKTKRLKRKRS